MSMNLHCKQVELYQTPTQITEMCYSNGDGGWQGILFRYKRWVMWSVIEQHVWDDEDELAGTQHVVLEHFEKLDDAAATNNGLDFEMR